MSPSKNSKPPTNRTDWSAQDDFIAPTHTSPTISTLQRWAHATANLPSQGYHWKEAQMVQRVRRRYEADNVVGLSGSFPKYSEKNTDFGWAGDMGDGKGSMERNGESKDEKDAGKGKKKRRLSMSSPPSGHTKPQNESITRQNRDPKRRRRATSPSPLRHYDTPADQEMSDAESSIWSFPGSEDGLEMAYDLDGKSKMG